MHTTNARQRATYARARAKPKHFAIGSFWLRTSYRIRCKSSRIRCMRFCCPIKFPQSIGHAQNHTRPNAVQIIAMQGTNITGSTNVSQRFVDSQE